MSRIAYVNGRYVPHSEASVHIEDRGYQFSDGVYEVVAVRDGKFCDKQGHLDRLDRSLKELRIKQPVGRGALEVILKEVARRNGVKNGLVYMQVTRGVFPRNHPFPPESVKSALVVTAKRAVAQDPQKTAKGISVISVEDQRWARRDIKTVGLLANVLAMQAAKEAGAYEAWQVDADGYVTEGSSTNAWIVTKDNELVTRPATHDILRGITRETILGVAAARGLKVVERPFTLEEAYAAKEAFITSASSYVLPVVRIDDRSVGNGAPGETTLALVDGYIGAAMADDAA
jgi:D-alanine transaminase